MKQIKNSGVAHIVLDCSTEKIYDVLKQSQQIGMMSDYHSYLITSLVCVFFTFKFCVFPILYFKLHFQQDLQTIDLDEFKYSGTNITAFRLVDPENSLVHKTVSEWSQSELRSDKKPNERVFQVNSQFALFYLLRDISFTQTFPYTYKKFFFLFFHHSETIQ